MILVGGTEDGAELDGGEHMKEPKGREEEEELW